MEEQRCCDCKTELIGHSTFERRCNLCEDKHKTGVLVKDLRDLRVHVPKDKSVKWEDDVEDLMYKLLGDSK
jgi:hypothetical protein